MKDSAAVGTRVLGVLLWIAILFELVTLGGAGVAKFGSPTWPEMFIGFGYPGWGATIVGALELGGALALLFARTRAPGALLLMAIMTGAFVTVMTNETELGLMQPVVHLVALGFILWKGRRPRSPSPEDRIGAEAT